MNGHIRIFHKTIVGNMIKDLIEKKYGVNLDMKHGFIELCARGNYDQMKKFSLESVEDEEEKK